MPVDEHSKISPSMLYRLFDGRTGEARCPGSVRLCAKITRRSNSVPAMEGSIAHGIGEQCLLKNCDAKHFKGHYGCCTFKGLVSIQPHPATNIGPGGIVKKIDQKMIDAVQEYLDTVRATKAEMPSGTFAVEQKVDLSYWLGSGSFGTCDHVALEPLGTVVVDDYKNGAGVGVEVEWNPQLLTYALGAIGPDNENMVEDVVSRITQPRKPHHDGPVRSFNISAEDLLDWGETILKPGVARAKEPNAQLLPGDWCQFCDAKTICPKLRKQALEAAEVIFDEVDLVPTESAPTFPDPQEMTGDQLAKVLHFTKAFKFFIDAIQEEAYNRVDTGRDNAPPNFKIVEGRASRSWAVDDYTAVKFCAQYMSAEDCWEPTKALSVSQMENSLKHWLKEAPYSKADKSNIWSQFNSLVDVKRGRSMVPLSNKKPALQSRAELAFDDVEDFDEDPLA